MEAESTGADATLSNSFDEKIRTCTKCKATLTKEKEPLFLSCLHTVCKECFNSMLQSQTNVSPHELENGVVVCPACKGLTPQAGVIPNLFVAESANEGTSASDVASEESVRQQQCACEENAATHFCEECKDWLCTECVEAHRRVRITKDHHVQPKENVTQGGIKMEDKFQKCPQHPMETLRLFCDTCDRLTCRDCQLSQHKDHKYEFLDEAAQNYRHYLTELMNKVHEKQSYVNNAKGLIEKRSRDISKKEEVVIEDIKLFVKKLITEINTGAKKLLADLQSISKAKVGQLSEKSNAIGTLSKQLDYVAGFAQFLLHQEDVGPLLFSKRQVVHQLRKILKLRCEVPNPNHEVDIQFKYDSNILHTIVPRMGSIVVNGVPFNSRRPNQPSATQSAPAASQNPTQPSQQQQVARSGFKEAIKKQQHLQMQMERLNRQGFHTRGPNMPPATATSLPQQSSNISSSNHMQHFFAQSPHGPPNVNVQKMHGERHKINLAQLQQERIKRLMAANSQSVSSSHPQVPPSPIIIQPDDADSPMFPDCSQNQYNGHSSMDMKSFNRPPTGLLLNTLPESQSAINSLMSAAQSTTSESPSPVTTTAESHSEEAQALLAAAQENPGPSGLNGLDPSIFTSESEDIDFSSLIEDSAANSSPRRSGSRSRSQAATDSNDPSEDWCAVCKNGGNLLCCDSCPKVFHLNCYVPIIKSFPRGNEDWLCCLCKSDQEMRLEFPEKNSPTPPAGSKRKSTSTSNLSPKEQQICERILLELFSHEMGSAFHEPVSKSVPNYHNIVAHPMALTTIKKKLADNSFKQIEEFLAHCLLVFYNCSLFNDNESDVGKAGLMLKAFFESLVDRFLPYIDLSTIDPSKDFLPTSSKKAKRSKDSSPPSKDPSVERETESPALTKK